MDPRGLTPQQIWSSNDGGAEMAVRAYYKVDGVEALYVRTLRDRIDTRNGLRLVEYDVFEPINAVAHQANIFVPRDEQDRVEYIVEG